VEEVKGSKFRRTRRAKEAIKTPNFSSALSIDSGFSDLEEEDEDYEDEFVDNINMETEVVAPVSDQSVRPEAEEADPDLADPTFDHGATKKGDEVVKWYTVLAEYQHRRQLTALHNAVSALVGNFDAVIHDPSLDLVGGKEGVTTFGIFAFDKPTSDHKMLHASNTELVVSLESLPWMHETVFARVEKQSATKQLDTVASMRRRWSYATDLEGSKFEGGPAWLIEARARAMHSSAQFHEYRSNSDMMLDPTDPVVREVMVKEKTDTVSTRSPDVFTFSEEWAADNSQSDSVTEFSIPFQEVAKAMESPAEPSSQVEQAYETCKKQTRLSVVDRGRSSGDGENDETELFHSLHFQDSDLDDMHNESWISGTSFHGEDDVPLSPHHTSSKTEMMDTPSEANGLRQEPVSPAASNSAFSAPLAGPAPVTSAGTMSQDMAAMSRINRMESLMEQLVILSAQQQTQQLQQGAMVSADAPTSGMAMAPSVSANRTDTADILQQEVAELRSQVQARAAEDDALRNEILMLRQQLADRRAERNSKREERSRLLKIPDVLRFVGRRESEDEIGATSAAANDSSFTNQKTESLAVKTPEPHAFMDSSIDSFYETPLQPAMISSRAGTNGSTGGARRRGSFSNRPARRSSGGEPSSRSYSTALGAGGAPTAAATTATSSAGNSAQQRLGRRPSMDNSTSNMPTPRRRSSGGGVARRMSGDHHHQVHFNS